MLNLRFPDFGLGRRAVAFARDHQGMSAVEFAMILPLMVTLYVGGSEVSQAVSMNRKVTITARSVADLVARTTSVNSTDMTNILNASRSVIAPYSTSFLIVKVSSVTIDNNGQATIAWSKSTPAGNAHSVGSSVPLTGTKAPLAVPNSSLIWGEVQYTYKPALGYVITGTLTLKDEMFMSPRMSTSVTCNSC